MYEYLSGEYARTKWQFTPIAKLKRMFSDWRDQLNVLARLGIVRKREGVNDDLVELINK